MSSINMYGTERVWENILEPFYLVQLVNVQGEYKVGMGEHDRIMKEGFYGLTLANDPAFIFEFRPLPSFSDEEFDKALEEETIDFGEYLECQEYWREQFAIAYFDDCLDLYDACRAKGYDRKEDGDIGIWLGEYLTPIIQNLREPDRIAHFTLTNLLLEN